MLFVILPLFNPALQACSSSSQVTPVLVFPPLPPFRPIRKTQWASATGSFLRGSVLEAALHRPPTGRLALPIATSQCSSQESEEKSSCSH